MASWIFAPGHTEAEFRARHMMVMWVRGLFKDIHGALELSFDRPLEATFHGEIDATGIWTGQPERDAHLRSADFFDVENHPKITLAGRFAERTGDTSFKGSVELTIRGVTRTVPLDVSYLGEWRTPLWVDGPARLSPNIARKPEKAISWVASENASPLMRKIDSGASGLRWRSSLITNVPSSANDPASYPTVRASPQATSGAFTRA